MKRKRNKKILKQIIVNLIKMIQKYVNKKIWYQTYLKQQILKTLMK